MSMGLAAGLLAVKPGTKSPDGDSAMAINSICFEKGLLMFSPVGLDGGCIKIAPPLTIPGDALDEGLNVLAEACDKVFGEGK